MKTINVIIRIVTVLLGIPLVIVLFLILLYIQPSKENWFKMEFDNGKYIIECQKDKDVAPMEYISIMDAEGDTIYEFETFLYSDYHHGVYDYKLEQADKYIKVSFINANNKVCQTYRFYYEELDKLVKIKDND